MTDELPEEIKQAVDALEAELKAQLPQPTTGKGCPRGMKRCHDGCAFWMDGFCADVISALAQRETARRVDLLFFDTMLQKPEVVDLSTHNEPDRTFCMGFDPAACPNHTTPTEAATKGAEKAMAATKSKKTA